MLAILKLSDSQPPDSQHREYRIQTLIHQHIHSTHNKKQKSQRCDQEPIFKTKLVTFCRCPNNTLTKKMLFAKSRYQYKRDPWINIAKMSLSSTQRGLHKTGFAALVDRVVASATPR